MQRITPSVLLLLSAAALVALIGYKSLENPVSAARSDAQIAGDIHAKIIGEPAFSRAGSPDVHVTVTNGVATLSGEAPDDQTRLMAATDASKVDGVKEVVNDMTLSSAQAQKQSQNQNTSVCAPPHHVHHRAKVKKESPPELASNYAPPAPAPTPAPPPAPVYPPPPCGCVPMAVLPAPFMVPAPPVVYAYGYPPAIGVGIYARPGWVRPYGYARPYAYARPGGRAFVR